MPDFPFPSLRLTQSGAAPGSCSLTSTPLTPPRNPHPVVHTVVTPLNPPKSWLAGVVKWHRNSSTFTCIWDPPADPGGLAWGLAPKIFSTLYMQFSGNFKREKPISWSNFGAEGPQNSAGAPWQKSFIQHCRPCSYRKDMLPLEIKIFPHLLEPHYTCTCVPASHERLEWCTFTWQTRHQVTAHPPPSSPSQHELAPFGFCLSPTVFFFFFFFFFFGDTRQSQSRNTHIRPLTKKSQVWLSWSFVCLAFTWTEKTPLPKKIPQQSSPDFKKSANWSEKSQKGYRRWKLDFCCKFVKNCADIFVKKVFDGFLWTILLIVLSFWWKIVLMFLRNCSCRRLKFEAHLVQWTHRRRDPGLRSGIQSPIPKVAPTYMQAGANRSGFGILVRGGQWSFDPRGALSLKFAQNCLKTAWFWKKILGLRGPGPKGPLVSACACTQCQHWK